MQRVIQKIQNSSISVALFGDVMLDHYLIGNSERISPEAPIPIVDIEKEEWRIGGAGNVATNLRTFGASVSLFSIVGKDSEGERLLSLLRDLDIDTSGVKQISNRKTTTKSRVISKHQQIVRFDIEDREEIADEVANSLLEKFQKELSSFDIVLISDYGKGVVSQYLSRKVIEISKSRNLKVLIDPKGKDYSKYRGAYLIKPNRKEAKEAIPNFNLIDDIGLELLNRYQFEKVVITLSEDGIKLFEEDRNVEHFPTEAKEIFDVTGAGDTVLASLGVTIASGIDIRDSIRFANLASAIAIGKVGTSTVSLEEINHFYRYRSSSKIQSWQGLKEILDRERDKKIVFTNGCFDILHVGHVKYLEEAKSLGDILIVGLNSDSSVRRLKGEKRPINNETDRAYILAGLQAVDYIVIFEEDTPYRLIEYLKPDILVKGGDYRGKEIVGADLVDEVKLIEFVKEKSTSKTIEKILSFYYDV